MKYSVILFCLLFTHGFLYAQSYSIEWSELQNKKGSLVHVLTNKSDEFYALRWTGGQILGSYQVSRHKDFKLEAKGRIKLQAEHSMANFEDARMIGGNFTVFMSDRREGQDHLYMQKYTPDLEPIAEPIKLASFDLDRKRMKGWFDVKVSSNEKYFSAVWEVPGKNEARDLYGFKVYDTSFNLVNEGEYPLPFDPELSTIHSHHISNNGDYFLALTEYQEDEKKKLFKNHLNYKALHIYHITDEGLSDFTLDLKGRRVEAMTMNSDDNNIFTITGIYGEMNVEGVSGVFFQRVDLKSGKILDTGFKKFTDEFITRGWTDREKDRADRREDRGRGEPLLYNYRMREATILSDGSIVGTMEQYFVQLRAFSDTRSGQSSNTYYYYYNDIIAYKINPDGEFAWLKKVRKLQVSTNDGGPYSSYESFIDNGKVYFIFNDNVRNYDDLGQFIDVPKLYTANYSKKRNSVALSEIDLETGEMRRKTFFDRSEINALAMPKLFDVNYQRGEMLLYSIWGRKEKFGVLKFKE